MLVIGRVDRADFPELFLKNISIKIDTGAYTSTIHSHHIREVTVDGITQVEFKVLDPTHRKYSEQIFKTGRFKKKYVKNSFGISEERYLIETTIILFGNEYPIDLSLSERSDMRYPILIGRKLLKNRFIVDPSRKNLSYKLKKEKNSKDKT